MRSAAQMLQRRFTCGILHDDLLGVRKDICGEKRVVAKVAVLGDACAIFHWHGHHYWMRGWALHLHLRPYAPDRAACSSELPGRQSLLGSNLMYNETSAVQGVLNSMTEQATEPVRRK